MYVAAPGSEGAPPPPRGRPATAIPLDRRYDFTRDELEAMARNCELRTDLPGVRTINEVPMSYLEDKDLEALDLRPGERPVVEDALRGYRQALNDLSRQWIVEVSGDPHAADGLDFLDFSNPDHPSIQRLESRLSLRHIGEGARRVAEELAGRRRPSDPPPADPVIASVASFYRRELALGDRFEDSLAQRLGPARARTLRRGPLSGQTHRSGCP